MPRFGLSFFIVCVVFVIASAAGAEESERNPKVVQAEDQFRQAVDKAKTLYQAVLENELATAKRRGNLALYEEIEKEIEYMKDSEVFSLSPYNSSNASIKTAKTRLGKGIEAARTRFTRAIRTIARDVLRDGDVEGARELERLADRGEPDGTKEETELIVRESTLDAIPVLEGDWEKHTPKARKVRRFSSTDDYRQTYAVHWSPDDAVVAAAMDPDFPMYLWDAKTGKNLETLKAGGDVHYGSADFTADSRKIILGSNQGHIRLYDIAKKDYVWKQKNPSGINDVLISPKGDVACAVSGKIVVVRSMETGEQLKILERHTDTVGNVAFSPRGDRFATVSSDQTAVVWNTTNWLPIRELRVNAGNSGLVDFSENGRFIVTITKDDSITIWDAKTGEALRRLGPFHGRIVSLAFSPDGEKLAVGRIGGGDQVFIIDLKTLKLVAYIPGHGSWNCRMAWSRNGRFLLTAGDAPTIFELPPL